MASARTFLNRKNVELFQIGDNLSFSASFIPQIGLLIIASGDMVPIIHGGGWVAFPLDA
jgi:hypothetical protein